MTGDRKEDDGADDAATPAPPCSFAPDRIYAELGTDGAIGLIPLTPDFWPSLIEAEASAAMGDTEAVVTSGREGMVAVPGDSWWRRLAPHGGGVAAPCTK